MKISIQISDMFTSVDMTARNIKHIHWQDRYIWFYYGIFYKRIYKNPVLKTTGFFC